MYNFEKQLNHKNFDRNSWTIEIDFVRTTEIASPKNRILRRCDFGRTTEIESPEDTFFQFRSFCRNFTLCNPQSSLLPITLYKSQ